MSCRRVSRELLERFRFGEELDARSDPHLAHLESCTECRHEVGLDRALVAQLRRALRARVEGFAPSPASWQLVRQRALAIDATPTWSRRILHWARFAPAGVAMVLIFAVVAVHESSQPGNLQTITEHNWPGFQRVAEEPEAWKMPWWLRDRPIEPAKPAPHRHLAISGLEVAIAPDPGRPTGPTE